MTKHFLHPDYTPTEKSDQLIFAGNRLDRLSEERKDDCVQLALKDPNSRLLGITNGRAILKFENESPRGLMTNKEMEPLKPKLDQAVLLGFDGGAPRLAVPLDFDPDDEKAPLPNDFKAVDFRSIAAQGLLTETLLGQLAQAGAYLSWHANSRFCGRCGGATEMRGGGVKRHCLSCERDYFPRIDPVVIMLMVKGDKCLLGRSPHFPPGMYSALAGFVEAGESIEMAVRRETFEESGIRVGDVKYHATQPWPFPHTLMIGCFCQALDDVIEKDDSELEDCRWFSRDQVKSILAGDGPKNEDGSPEISMPLKFAIAGHLVRDWVEGRSLV